MYELVESRFALAHLKNGETVTDPTANIGGDACFIYLKDGELRASTLTITEAGQLIKIVNGSIQKDTSSSIGGEGKLVKIVNGKIVEDTSATVGDGITLVFLSNGQLTESEQSVGDDTHPVKLDNGKLVQVAGELATKVAPALERKNDPRELNEAERQVPTTPTPSSEDPGTMVANKEYVDSFASSNATYGYGVVDGSICNDAGDNPCVTSFDVGTTRKEITYTTLNDCYLYIQVEGLADIYSDESSPALNIQINGQSLGRLLDHMDDTYANNLYDRPACGIPVAKGSIVRIANVDEDAPMFSTWGTGAALVITEYRLSSISPTIEMPKYDREAASDIHLAAFSEEGYIAPRRGYLLASIFDETGKYVPSNKSMKIYINDILVMNGRNIVKQLMTDATIDDPTLFNNTAGVTTKNMTVQAGDTLPLGNPDHFKVYKVSTDPVTHKPKYTQVLNPGTVTGSVLTFDSSLVGNNVVVIDGVKTIEKVKLTDTGACLIPVNYKDVIKIRTATETGADQHGDASTWPSTSVYSLTADETGEIGKAYYKATDDGMINVSAEVVGQTISDIGYPVYECEDISDDDEFHEWQALFLRTRQTGTDTESEELERDDFVMGGFMDGTVFQDDRGNELITEVPYTEWALTQDADSLYTYKYIVKKDCMLYMSFLVHANNPAPDKVKITLNGKEFDYYYENDATISGTLSDSDKQLMLPIAAGTVVGFHSKAQPNHNIIGTADSGTGTYAIKIKEYKLIASGETADVSNIRVGGGVIDGTVSNVSEIDLTVAGNNKPTYTYRTTKDCLLLIEVNKAVIGSSAIQVQVGSTTVGYLSDNESTDTDNDSMRIPVRANTDIVLVGDGTSNIFSSTPEGSVLRFTELKLTAIAKQVGMPDYDSGVDITSEVTRTTISEARGFKAPSEGYVLFQPNDLTATCVIAGKINDWTVFVSGVDMSGSDSYYNHGLVPVREGDVIDFLITNGNKSALVVQPNAKVFFFPLKTVGEINVDQVELPIIDHPFDNATNNPFLDHTKVDVTKLTFTSDMLRNKGHDIDVGKADIRTYIDVFYPRYDVLGNLMKDAEGHVLVDTNKPQFRFEPAVDRGGGVVVDEPFSVQRVGDGAQTALVSWPYLNNNVNTKLYLRGIGNFKTGVTTPEVDPSTGAAVGDYYAAGNVYQPSTANWAATRGFTGYYIRLTAVIDPRSPNVKVSKSGMFIDGQINIDDNGNTCKTLVPYTVWADGWDATTGKCTYEYTVKTDCFLYINCQTELNWTSGYEETSILLNGEVIDTYAEATGGTNLNNTPYQVLTLPVKRGTKISFVSNRPPIGNQTSVLDPGVIDEEAFSIKLIEFKMGTELNPAQFPSLSVRVFDIQNSSAADNAEFLNRHYTWTEDQLKQVFGSMFSLDEAKIDFRAVFYTGDAITAYDTTTNKVEDPFVEITDNGANHVHKLSAVVLDNDGTKTLDVMVPQLPYFVSGVTWDGVNGKVVLRNQRTGIGGDLAVAAGVRMRLLMHISDRRGETGDSCPNGISSTSKMIRQGDMNLTSGNTAGNIAYTNEITTTVSGTCVIMSNFDSDAVGVDHSVVAVQALIDSEWKTIQTAPTVTVTDGRGVQSFSFPIEANTKLRMATDAAVTSAAGNISGGGSPLTPLFTHAHQALCWVIPTSKYLNPEQNLPGSAGVIDGSIWKKADGTDEVTSFTKAELTGIKSLSYNVKNDCYLYISFTDVDIEAHGIGDLDYIDVNVNGVPAARLLDTADASDGDNGSVGICVARGSVVELVGDGTHSLFDTQYTSASVAYPLTFTEFKLRATNVVAAMPDWDDSKKVAVTDGYIAESDGFLRINVQYGQVSGHYSVLVNGIVVWKHHDGDEDRAHGDAGVIPICRGDKVTISKSSSSTQTADITFYPVKMREIKNEVVEEAIDVLSKVNEVVLVDKPANDAIFNSAAALMSNTAMVPTTSEDGVDHPAGQFPAPSWTGYDTVCKFIRGVTEEELRTLTGNALLSLKNADLEIKLVTYSSGTGEEYEEVEPLGLVASSNTQPRAYIVPVRPIVRTINGVRSVRVPWPSKFSTASLSHWSTDTSATFFPSQYGDVVTLGSSINAKVVLTIKQRSSSAA